MENIDKNINKASPNKKLLLLKKINIKQYPELSKKLNQYFWDTDKYFQTKYKDFHIVVGNKKNQKTKTPLGNKRKVERRKTRKFINISINSNDKDKVYLNDSKAGTSRFDRKRGLSKNVKETGLKIGQKYINDLELEDLFNAFKTVQNINKKRATNFALPKDYVDKNSPIIATKTTINFNKFLYERKNTINNMEYKNCSDNEGKGGIESGKNIFKKNTSKVNNMNSIINNEYSKTFSNVISNNNLKKEINDNIKDSSSKNINFCSISKISSTNENVKINNNANILNHNPLYLLDINITDKKSKTANNFYYLNKAEEKNIISRKNLIRRQNQFLLDSKEGDYLTSHEASKKYYAKILANQEQALSKKTKDQLKINNFYNTLLRKTNKSKESLLMTNIDLYRIRNELKDKFDKLNSKLEPEHLYNWVKDLREDSRLKTDDNNVNTNYYNIRDPFSKTMINSLNNKYIFKKKNMKYYRVLMDEAKKINNNFEGLYIKGKNLLKTEYEHVKLLKNKKIINNYEMYLPSSDVEDILFTDKKYSNRIKDSNVNK